LTVTSVSANGLLVGFKGTVGSAESAFRTHINSYRLASGRVGTATTSAVSFPSSIASQVASVVGLDTLVRPHDDFKRSTTPAKVKPVTHHLAHYGGAPKACAEAAETAKAFGGLTDDQIAHTYGLDGLYKSGDLGAGQTIALYELEAFSPADAHTFDSCYFTSAAAKAMAGRLTVRPVDGGAGGGSGSGEAILDVDDVSALAPKANIEVYEAPLSDAAALDEYNQIVSDDSASVVSSSWGECEQDLEATEPGTLAVENTIFEQAALQGQTVLAASGDSGNNACEIDPPTSPQLSVGDPASQPFVTGVGGTTTTNAANPPTQTVWNDGVPLLGAAGGGMSSVWGAPSWQQPALDTAGAVQGVTDGAPACPQSSNGALCREVPDVSAQADEITGGITVYAASMDGWLTAGGTSSAAPIWAAILTDINKSAGCTATGGIGFASPSLYAVASTPAGYAASFNDLVAGQGDNDILDEFDGKDYATRTGYDMASGLGTPKVTRANGSAGLASYMCALGGSAATTRPVITSLSKPDVDTTPTGSLTLTGTGFTGAKALSVGGYAVPSTHWSVTSPTTIVISSIPTAAEAGTAGIGPQDGSGRAPVYVTGANGTTSVTSAATSLVYVDGTSSALPSVAGVVSYGGAEAGGNTVTVLGSGFNFAPVTATVGGVAATHVTVLSANRLTMTVPAYVSGTTACASGDDAVNDACQAQVVVHNANGVSATATIHPSYSGAPFGGPTEEVPPPDCVTGATCELAPAASEYDYLPAPVVTSVTTTAPGDPTVWVSEEGDTLAEIDGRGFDPQGLLGTFIGSRDDYQVLSVTPTEIDVIMLAHRRTPGPASVPLTVSTLAGRSASTRVTFAGVPSLTKVSPKAGPTGGGSTIHLTGTGFEGTSGTDGGAIEYEGLTAFSIGLQLSGYTATSASSITATTPQGTAGPSVIMVCTITNCSSVGFRHFTSVEFTYFAPGNPVVTSVTPSTGDAAGGEKVVIVGRNLANVVKVEFGSKVAPPSSTNPLEALFGSRNTSTRVVETVPAGRPGQVVAVRVVTAESQSAGGKPSAVTAATHYRYVAGVPGAPRNVVVHKQGSRLRVHWKQPESDGGSRITGYRVSAVATQSRSESVPPGIGILLARSGHHPKLPPTVAVTTKASARAASLTGLRAGWSYIVEVRAINRHGRGRATDFPRPLLIKQSA
jgi:kumamolisin